MTSQIPDASERFLENLNTLDSAKDQAHLYKFKDGQVQQRTGVDKFIKQIKYAITPSASRLSQDFLVNQLAIKVVRCFSEQMETHNFKEDGSLLKNDHIVAFMEKNVLSKLTLSQSKLIHKAFALDERQNAGDLGISKGAQFYVKAKDQSLRDIPTTNVQVRGELLRHTQELQHMQTVLEEINNLQNTQKDHQLVEELYSNQLALPILEKTARDSGNSDIHEFIVAILDLRETPKEYQEHKIDKIMERFIRQPEDENKKSPVEPKKFINLEINAIDEGDLMQFHEVDTSRSSVELDAKTRVALLKNHEGVESFDEAFKQVVNNLIHNVFWDTNNRQRIQDNLQTELGKNGQLDA